MLLWTKILSVRSLKNSKAIMKITRLRDFPSIWQEASQVLLSLIFQMIYSMLSLPKQISKLQTVPIAVTMAVLKV